MNTPNPLVPQGSLQEQSKRKSQIRIIVFSILAIHVVLLGALLTQSCKREETPAPKPEPTALPPLTNTDSYVPAPPPPMSNPPAPPVVVTTPPPAPPIIETPPATATEHVIAKGDTFGSLAKKYGVSIKAIQRENPGVDSTKLKINQKIKIPAKPPGGAAAPSTSAKPAASEEAAAGETLYTVKKNDTLTSIAKAHGGIKVKALQEANNLKTSQIKPGQKLKLPAKSSAAPMGAASLGAPVATPATSAPMPTVPTNP